MSTATRASLESAAGPERPGDLPLSLYIHVPWCVRRCPYCDFNSHALRDSLPERAYVDALIRDLALEARRAGDRGLHSVFIGGGTPSLLRAESVARVLEAVRARFHLPEGTEITLEANPGAVEAGRFAEFRAAGINRLSIGVQSFEDTMLQRLGRIHSAREAQEAVRAARRAGFDNLNLDLMYALPGQSAEQALADVEQALALEPEHLSHYQLTIEPNTAFHSDPPSLPGEDGVWAMEQSCRERLADAGLARYEVSAFAREGRRCRHNLSYWRFDDYLGVGAGAHGKLSTGQGVQRTAKQRHPRAYMGAAGEALVSARRWLDAGDLRTEFMLNALRLVEGFSPEQLTVRTGLDFEAVRAPVQAAVAEGLLRRAPAGRLAPTQRGLCYLDDLVARFA